MNKSILSVCGAFISFLCVIILLTAFAKSGEDLFAILAVIFVFGALSFVSYGIEGTELADKMADLFREEASHE